MITVFRKKEEVKSLSVSLRKDGTSVGFVPTMGYLHQGHLSLVAEAKKRCDEVIVSIYVNPTQFGISEDFSSYPRDLETDLNLLMPYEPLYIFCPADSEMYNTDHKSWIEVSDLSNKLCGKSRKNHFRGVSTVVAKMMNIILPDLMFMGEKDFQQLVILKKMISDLDFHTEIVPCSIVREDNGLAMSSRNKYLSPTENEKAASIYESLTLAQDLFNRQITKSEIIISKMRKIIEEKGGIIDYIEVIDTLSLESIPYLVTGCRILAAVYFGKTRLIDNAPINKQL